jgi:hypothetical protein
MLSPLLMCGGIYEKAGVRFDVVPTLLCKWYAPSLSGILTVALPGMLIANRASCSVGWYNCLMIVVSLG